MPLGVTIWNIDWPYQAILTSPGFGGDLLDLAERLGGQGGAR